jgi:ribosomal protein S18 acetylase RimI-like enzyme
MNKKSSQQDINELEKKHLLEKYQFRSIRPEEADEAATIEQICFPPNEACSEQHMKERIAKAPELFLVAVDKSTGRLAGFLNGLSTDESAFRDEFFTDANLYDLDGKNIMLLGLDVLPEYRRQGLAKELVYRYARRAQENGRQMLILTCLKSKVKMYEKMGFVDRGIANSTWGGEEWHEMTYMIGM